MRDAYLFLQPDGDRAGGEHPTVGGPRGRHAELFHGERRLHGRDDIRVEEGRDHHASIGVGHLLHPWRRHADFAAQVGEHDAQRERISADEGYRVVSEEN